uniref:Phot1 n=1 Tax=Arundo donax TaxID=35708 RepID=A0A0A9FG62_ARUDO
MVMNQTKVTCRCLSFGQVKNFGTFFTCNRCVIKRFYNKGQGYAFSRYLVCSFCM